MPSDRRPPVPGDCRAASSGELVINEALSNPEGTDSGAEFIEIVNLTEVALSLDHHHEGALSGLARAYAALGDREQAQVYAQRVHEERSRNAYYHFALAQAEFDKGRYDDALKAIDSAIGLERRNPRFRFMKGLVQAKLGDMEGAKRSFRKANRLGRYDDLKKRYIEELAGGPAAQPRS